MAEIAGISMAARGRDQDMAARLLAWYDGHARELPWRAKPGQRQDPYRVWLSEIMLQQTTVAAVKGYYQRFLARWPTVAALAAAEDEEVMKAWAGLGYYARARNLLAAARAVADQNGGHFPASVDALRQLPGVGPYTAAAIAAIAFDLPVAAVDGNVERVVSRFYAIKTPLPGSKPEIKERAVALVPDARPGDFAQALMDLGAAICTPRSPQCLICPWREGCQGLASGLAEQLPRKQPKTALPVRHGVVYWVEREDGQVLLERRSSTRMLGGMIGFPTTAWDKRDNKPAPPLPTVYKSHGVVEHSFTHFHLKLMVERAKVPKLAAIPGEDFRWVPVSELEQAGLPSLFMKVVAVLRRP